MNEPRLRFKKFKENWNNDELGNIAIVTKLAGFEFTKYMKYSSNGKIIALRSVNIENNHIDLHDVKYIDKSDFSKLNRSKLYKNDIIFSYVGSIGKSLIINENNKFYLAPNVALIRLKYSDSHFVHQLISTNSYYNHYVLPLVTTSSQPALSMKSLRKFVINIPSNRLEQQKIGSFFANLDKQIEL